MSCFKSFIHVSFSAYCQTVFGQTVHIVGNSQELGNWTPFISLKLQTTPKEYPIWYSKHPIIIEKLSCIQFKICVVDKNRQVVRWQNIQNNRTICLKKSCTIFISFGEKETEIDDDDTDTEGSEQGTSGKRSRLAEIKEEPVEDEDDNRIVYFDKSDQLHFLGTASSLQDSVEIEKVQHQIECQSLKELNNSI